MPRIGNEPDLSPPNSMILEKRWWKNRVHQPQREEDLKNIIELSYQILTRKIAGRSIIVNNEASLQLHFSQILLTVGRLYEFQSGDLFHLELEGNIPLGKPTAKNKNGNARVDILIALGKDQFFVTSAIELKYFKKKNHREPLNRYDAYADLQNLEICKEDKIDYGYMIIATDHEHYISQENYSPETDSFDFRNGKKYLKNTVLKYRDNSKLAPISLKRDIEFNWDVLPIWGTKNELYCLKVCI